MSHNGGDIEALVRQLITAEPHPVVVYGIGQHQVSRSFTHLLAHTLAQFVKPKPIVLDACQLGTEPDSAPDFWSDAKVKPVAKKDMGVLKGDWLSTQWQDQWVLMHSGRLLKPIWIEGHEAALSAKSASLLLVITKGVTPNYLCKRALADLENTGRSADMVVLWDREQPLAQQMLDEIRGCSWGHGMAKERLCDWIEHSRFLWSVT